MWIRRQYAPDEGFTQKDIRRNLHTVYIDLECSVCGYTTTLANLNGDESIPCLRCKEA